jgi:hypothetical protein
VDVATPRKTPSAVVASGPDAAIALVVAIAIRIQAAAAAHNSRDDQFCFAVFSTEIMTLSFRESDFLLHCTWVLSAHAACPVAALIIALLRLPSAFKIGMKHYYAHLSGPSVLNAVSVESLNRNFR